MGSWVAGKKNSKVSVLFSGRQAGMQANKHLSAIKNADPQYPGWISSPGPRAAILHPGRRPEHEAYDTVLPHGRCGRFCALSK